MIYSLLTFKSLYFCLLKCSKRDHKSEVKSLEHFRKNYNNGQATNFSWHSVNKHTQWKFFPSINQYWWSSGTGNSRVVNLCDLFQVLQIVSKLSKWSWRGISSLWSSSALARENVRHMLCRCLNWTLIQVRWYYEDTCMVAYWGGGGGGSGSYEGLQLKMSGLKLWSYT